MSSATDNATPIELLAIVYGANHKRVEVSLRPKPPAAMQGNPNALGQWVNQYMLTIGQDLKHSSNWECEFCSKPARETQYQFFSWLHLSPPKINIYIHQLCDCNPESKCADQVEDMQRMSQPGQLIPPRQKMPPGSVFPLSSACAACKGDKGLPTQHVCTGCKLTRYCSPECQREAWQTHKKMCKVLKIARWAYTPDLLPKLKD